MNFRKYTNVTEIVIPANVQMTQTNTFNICAYMANLKTAEIVFEDNCTTISRAYYNCRNLISAPAYGNNITNMRYAYYNCQNLTDSPICGDKVIDMFSTYQECRSLTGSPACGSNVINMQQTYYNCSNLTGSPVCGSNVTNMFYTYGACSNLTGSPICGPNVIDMSQTYYGCSNLTGSPVCGDKVSSMIYAYSNCTNLTGSPVCGNNVMHMQRAYYNCTNLTGSPVCGPNVTIMDYAYANCSNLTGSPVCGPKVTTLTSTYQNCPKIQGNAYFYSNLVSNVYYCFNGRDTTNRLNIYTHAGSTTNMTLRQAGSDQSLIGSAITWIDDTANKCYYNTVANIYIYPVGSVDAMRLDNEYTTSTTMTTGNYTETSDNLIMIKKKYDYSPTEITMDSGYTYVMSINTAQLENVTVESMEVK